MPCPAALAAANLKLTHKAPENQSAGEGDAQGFILRILSLTPLFSVPAVDEATGGICVMEISLPVLPSPGRREDWGRAEMEVGLELTEKPQKPGESQALEYPRPCPLTLSGFGSFPPKPELLCPILAKFLRGKGVGWG